MNFKVGDAVYFKVGKSTWGCSQRGVVLARHPLSLEVVWDDGSRGCFLEGDLVPELEGLRQVAAHLREAYELSLSRIDTLEQLLLETGAKIGGLENQIVDLECQLLEARENAE